MSLNNTPSSERIHIGIFGRRNAGKSSLINALTGQNLAIVSDVRGTTTDPVFKSMELLPLGPIVMIDTPGLDDEGELGKLRIQKAYQVLNKTDIAVLVIDGTTGITPQDNAILTRIQDKNIPLLLVLNKADLVSEHTHQEMIVSTHLKYKIPLEHILWTNTTENLHIHELKERLGTLVPAEESSRFIVRDLVTPGDFIVLVVPIDSAAPKGRLILPQQQTIRDLLDAGTTAIVVKETELKSTLDSLGKKPALVITDSQAFKEVDKDTPSDIPLTSFSILFARYKGNLGTVVHGARALDTLEDGDTILISEGCTHHRQCDDIGTVKIPHWLQEYTGKKLVFETSSGGGFPDDLSGYRLIVHCGGCTLPPREMAFRIKEAKDQGIPIVNYGTLIAQLKGVLKRSIQPFADLGDLPGESI